MAPVVIPALAPTLDKSLKGDRSLCPVRALHYYLDRTLDLRQNKELVFVSFKKGFDKDISPATISSWIKQTVILCYTRRHQANAHSVTSPGGIIYRMSFSGVWRDRSHRPVKQLYIG